MRLAVGGRLSLFMAITFLQATVAVAATSDLKPEARDLVLTTKDLVSATRNLDLVTKDLSSVTEDLIEVKTAPKQVTIALPADILFDFDKSSLRPEAKVALAAAAELIRAGAKGTVRINGYTDAKGSDAHNQKLSQDRAESVRSWLADKESLGKMKFALKGFGAQNPVAPNTRPDGTDDPAGRQRNRRVEIVFAKR
jgi:outer membrane protein OmpA-like peptidoglycan-associated protein